MCLFIRSDLAFNPRPDLTQDGLESVWVNILLPKTKPILVGVCYRPPTHNNFYEHLEDSIVNSDRFMDQECVIMGDFNTNVHQTVDKGLMKHFRNFCRMFDLTQLISDSTRITNTSASCIDLILVSDKDKITQSGVISIGISDHFLTFCTRKVSRGTLRKH